jgi:hypothetical protein
LQAIDRAIQPMAQARMARPDADLIKQEFSLTARLMRHACRRALLVREKDVAMSNAMRRELDRDLEGFIPQYKQIWLARHRPGGLADSVARFETVREGYALA